MAREYRLCGVLIALVAFASPARAEVWRLTVERRVEASSCGSAVADFTHTLLAEQRGGEQHWVDLDATHWDVGAPVEYLGRGGRLRGRERFRLFDGAVVVDMELRPAEGRFVARLSAEPEEIPEAAAQHLGLALPCSASGALAVTREAPDARDPARKVRLYRLLQTAADALFHEDPQGARPALAEARELDPDSALVRWMQARARFSEARSLSSTPERIAALHRAEHLADEALSLDPRCGEAHLWRASARGRIASAQGALHTLIASIGPGRGPAFVAESFEQAIELRPGYAYLGDSLYGDALFGAARLYRLLPDALWTTALLGVRGDIDRAVELARRALALVPGRIEYATELAADLLCRAERKGKPQDRDEGRSLLERALSFPAFTAADRRERRHAGRLLEGDASQACSYASDGGEDGAIGTGDEVASLEATAPAPR